MNMRLTASILLLIGLTVLIDVQHSRGNPSHKDPHLALAVHGDGIAKELHGKAANLDTKIRERLQQFLKSEQANRLEQINPRELGQTHLALSQLLRLADQLAFLGEPAGVDFQKRGTSMRLHVSRLIQRSQSAPSTQKYVNQVRLQLQKTAANRVRVLESVTKLCNDSKWDQGEKELYGLFDSLEPGTCFLSIEENRQVYSPFSQVQAAITREMTELRRRQGTEALQQAIASLAPNYEAILAEIDQAIEMVAKDGKAEFFAVEVSGPQLVDAIAEQWRLAQNGALQARAKQWALAGIPSYSGDYQPIQGGSNSEDPLVTAHAQFSEEVLRALGRLLQVDAQRCSSTEAEALYVAYLKSLAMICRQQSHQDLTARLTQSLAIFGKKLPSGGQPIGAYALATDELLRWRRRVVDARLATKQKDYRELPTVMKEASTSKQPYIGLFTDDPRQVTTAQLMAATNETLPPASERLLGSKVVVRDIIRISERSPAAIARYRDRCYSNTSVGMDTQQAIAALKRDLMATEATPPLTLPAMQASITADRGDMLAVGGEISGAYLETVVTRFGSLPPAAAILTSLGQLPTENVSNGSLIQALMRMDVNPQWVAHETFIVDIPSTP